MIAKTKVLQHSSQLCFHLAPASCIQLYRGVPGQPIENNGQTWCLLSKVEHSQSNCTIVFCVFFIRSSSEEFQNENRQIVVWVGKEEKIVCGLTKHTTSEHVVEALLEEYQVPAKNNNVLYHKEYFIMESWKNFKHILPPMSKILKLWKAWGAEQINVNFVLLNAITLYPCSMWWWSQKNIAPNNLSNDHNKAFCVNGFSLDMRKKIVKKAFRKLEKMKKDMDCPKENNMQQLLHIIMFQDNIIKQQMDRIKHLDKQLEAYDSCQQLQKMGCNGENTVSCIKANDHGFHTVDRFPEMDSLENLMHIQENLNHQHMLIRKLSDQIKGEISSMDIKEDKDFVEEGYTDKVKHVKQEIDESLQVGLRSYSLYSYIQKEIQHHDSMQLQQKKEYEILKDELKSVCGSNSSSSLYCTPQLNMSSDVSNSKDVSDIIPAVLSGMDIQNDTDSDTGISSTHSQDFEPIH
ncbi:ras association domain-containing protein 9 [Rhinoderma darwinii]|uniref:ras association domain-containing protein 9 n=1 Tax=Rhinoderma darwinii TaxID=43563 RepID=UPI003F6745B3